MIVNEQLAQTQFPGQDPIGQRITLDNPSAPDARWMTIVGVAKDAVQSSWSDDRMPEALSSVPADTRPIWRGRSRATRT